MKKKMVNVHNVGTDIGRDLLEYLGIKRIPAFPIAHVVADLGPFGAEGYQLGPDELDRTKKFYENLTWHVSAVVQIGTTGLTNLMRAMNDADMFKKPLRIIVVGVLMDNDDRENSETARKKEQQLIKLWDAQTPDYVQFIYLSFATDAPLEQISKEILEAIKGTLLTNEFLGLEP